MPIKPKVLLWDIETGYNINTAFSLSINGYLPYHSIIQERYVICASFKELGKPGITSFQVRADNPTKDLAVCKQILKHLSDADAVIAHNGDNFDLKFFNSRLIYWGLPPIPPLLQVDTLKMARQKFKFNSNRLDYLGKFLGCGTKIRTDNSLWLGCLHGDQSSIDKMVRYNQQDVKLLEKVYNRLAPYCQTKLNRAAFTDRLVCPVCGSMSVHQKGTRTTTTQTYARYRCNDCGAWSRAVQADKWKRAKLIQG